jgi:protocatechuate 3,4-dioxygenase beta subunit
MKKYPLRYEFQIKKSIFNFILLILNHIIMHRKAFLRTLGLGGAVTAFPLAGALAETVKRFKSPPVCTLIPSETAGPFPLDLTANTFYFRNDIRENKTGTPLTVKMKILGLGNCLPMPNLRVNIWHCDKDGLYSGYSQQNNAGQAAFTYLRGYQITDANGEVSFTTIFPGWYGGRIAHIHFQVFVSSAYRAISQMCFDTDIKNAIYTANPTLYTKGADPLTFARDNIFSDGYLTQLATLTRDTATGAYTAYLEVSIQGQGTVGVGHLEKESAKRFVMGQNFPNPCQGRTTIPLEMKEKGTVRLDIWDFSGKKVASVFNGDLDTGEHALSIDLEALGLPVTHYAYQIEVLTAEGLFTDCKVLSIK